ncbi:MAG TPA: putative PEP-binding protein [Candidatus Nanoarchaeia archaeon]|nr:putative PEP-binding protein [Candidatus Nanoarchaeia archaeon]
MNGVSPGIASGRIKHVTTKAEAISAKQGDIVYAKYLSPPLVCAASKASGFIIAGHEADHAVSYLKECWKPCVLSEKSFKEGTEVTINGMSGNIFTGRKKIKEYQHHLPLKYKGKTKIYLHLSIPEIAEKAAALNTDGVGLLRTNLIIEATGKHPYDYFVKKKKQNELRQILAQGIKRIAQAFAPKPVWIRTMDIPTDELVHFEGAQEKKELNPLLGWRGIIRELQQPELLCIEYDAITDVLKTCKNIGIIYPLVRDVSEYREAKRMLRKHGIIPHKDIKVGSMFETPSAALQIDEFIEEGLDLAFIGMNDLTQYTLAAERTNPRMKTIYNPIHPSVLRLVYEVIEKCTKEKIETTMSFLTPLKAVLPQLMEKGLSSVTLQADRINEIGKLIGDIER